MLEENDLADIRPFLIELVRKSGEWRGASGEMLDPSLGAEALRVEEETGASAHRLTELATRCSLLDASTKSYEDLFRTLLEPNEDGHPEQHGGVLIAVDFDQPLFDRLAEITRCICHNVNFELLRSERRSEQREASGEQREREDREERRVASGEQREEPRDSLLASRDSSERRERDSVHSRDSLLASRDSFLASRDSFLATRDSSDSLLASRDFAERILASRSKIGIASSGTTGKPKWVYHRMDTLARSVKVSPNHCNDIWGLAYAPDRFAGMQVFLQAICNLNTIVSLLGLPPDDIHTAIDTYSITHLSATPTWFRLLLDSTTKHESVRSITVGGEVCQPSLRAQLHRLFPNAKFRNIYASTEAGALFQSDADTFIVSKIQREFVRVIDGQLLLHASMIAESFRENGVDDFFPTGDEVEIVEESPLTLRILARRSDWINVGGVKVNPHAVEDALLQIEGVREAMVFAQKNSVVGNLVCADIVLDAKVDYTVADIRRMLSSQLDHYSIPRIIQFVNEIGISPSGKKGRAV